MLGINSCHTIQKGISKSELPTLYCISLKHLLPFTFLSNIACNLRLSQTSPSDLDSLTVYDRFPLTHLLSHLNLGSFKCEAFYTTAGALPALHSLPAFFRSPIGRQILCAEFIK
ncbi:hypothetical protein L2E82_16983 [Cichorium intybus]|uniref:Uncharacterized protein n=1 Tax=Cichorium intybus TaxID=13427 RepID=A0ACB9F6P0_CICIN|nr:hypothetical protein L2E82_16983 [Cichorium intybus]